MSETPSAIGSYVVVASLPPDESGPVYLVREDGKTGLDALRTLLLVSPALAADASFKVRFVEHARRCMKAQGDVALVPLDVGEHEGRPFVVHRFVPGATLRQLMAGLHMNARRLNPEVACAIALHIASGLDAAHDTPDEQGQPLELVHGSLNVDRLLVGFDGRIYVTGFGVERDATRPTPSGETRLSDARRYAAPEVLQGSDADTRADVHSIGVLLWEAITHRRLEPQAKSAGVPPSQFANDCPSALDLVVQQCLSEDPDRRPLTLDELAHLLTLGVQVANRVKLDGVGRVASVVVTPELERGRIKLPADVAKLFDQARPPLDPTALDSLTLPILAGTPRDFVEDVTKWVRPVGAPRVSAPPPRAAKDRVSKRPESEGARERPADAPVAESVPQTVETSNVRVSVPPPLPPPRTSVPPPIPPRPTSIPPPLPPDVAAKAAAFAKDPSRSIPTAKVPSELVAEAAKETPVAPVAKAPIASGSTSAGARALPAAKAPLPAAKPPLASGTTSAGARALPAAKPPLASGTTSAGARALPAAKPPLTSGTTSAAARALPAAPKPAAPAPAPAPARSVPGKVGAPPPKRTLMGVGLPEAQATASAPEASATSTPAVTTAAASTPASTTAAASTPVASAEPKPAVAIAPTLAAGAIVAKPDSLPPPPPRPASMPPPPPGVPESPFGLAPAADDPFGLGAAAAKPASSPSVPPAPLAVDTDWGDDEPSGAAPLDAQLLDPKAKHAPSVAALVGPQAAAQTAAPTVGRPLSPAPETERGGGGGRRFIPAALGLVVVLGGAAAAYFVWGRGTPSAATVTADQHGGPIPAETGSAPPTVVAAVTIDASAQAVDAGVDAATDAGEDAGFDAGQDAGIDAGFDAGAPEVAAVEPPSETPSASSGGSRRTSSRSSSSTASSSSRTASSSTSSSSSMTTASSEPPARTASTMTSPPPAMEEEHLSFRERRAARRAARRGDD